MPRKLVSKKDKRRFKKLIQQLVVDLSQSLAIVQESPLFIDCPNCIWDSINKKSSNVFDASFASPEVIFADTDQERTITPTSFSIGRCPVCIGEGQLFTSQEVCIPAMVNFISGGEGGRFTDLPVGKEGVNFLLVKTLACHYNLLAKNEIFTVQAGIKCEKFRPPFVRGLGGEDAVCEMLLQTTEAGQRATEEFGGNAPLSREDDPRRRIKGPTDIEVLRGHVRGG